MNQPKYIFKRYKYILQLIKREHLNYRYHINRNKIESNIEELPVNKKIYLSLSNAISEEKVNILLLNTVPRFRLTLGN